MTTKPRPLTGTSRSTIIRVFSSSVVCNIATALTGLVLVPYVLRGLHLVAYGEWATLTAIVSIGQLAESGAGTEIARRVAAANGAGDFSEVERAVKQGVTVLAGIAVTLIAIVVAGAHPIVQLIFSPVSPGTQAELALIMIGIVTLFALNLVASGFFSLLIGLQRGDYVIWSMTIGVLLGAGATIGGLHAGLGLWALFLGSVVQTLAGWIGPCFGIRRTAPSFRFRLERIPKGEVLAFAGLPMMVVAANASDVFDAQVDKLVLTHTAGPASSAMFQIGTSLLAAAKSVYIIPLAVMLAGTAELHQNDRLRLRKLERSSDSAVQAIAAVGSGGLLLFAEPFVRVWLGSGYAPAVLAIRALAISGLINAWTAPWTYFAIGRRKYGYVLVAATTTLVVNALCTIFLTPAIGLDGALIGSIAGSGSGAIIGWLVLRRWERRWWFVPGIRATACAALPVVCALSLHFQVEDGWLPLIGWALVYVAVVGGLLLLTRSLPMRISAASWRRLRLVWREETFI